MEGARLALSAVTCERGGRLLFEQLDISLASGEAAIVSGPNGVGKSSLIRIAAGLLPPRYGSVEAIGPRALLAEATALDGDRTVAEALRFWARIDGGADPDGRVNAALDRLELSILAPLAVRLLSTGQRRRVAFARVLAADAPIWLLDEPANGLDAAAGARLEDVLAEHRAGGGIVLIATHVPIALEGARRITLESGIPAMAA